MGSQLRCVQGVLVGVVGVAILGTSVHGTTSRPGAGPQPTNAAAFPMVFHTKDAQTGLEILTTRTKPDEVVVEVKDATVSIRKRISPGSSQTRLTSKSGVATMELRGEVFTVTTKAGQVAGSLADRDSLAPVQAAIGGSHEALLAGRLLARLALNPDSVPGHALLLTRALLQSASGDRTGTDSLAAWSKNRATRPAVKRVSVDDEDGPEYCWNTYVVAAVKIWDDYQDCFYHFCGTYQILCKLGCAVIYDLRAEGAFAWWIKCTAIRL